MKIINKILGKTIENQLLMIISGCAGTGKSQIINAITTYFKTTQRSKMLGKFAPTAKAAWLIGGITIRRFRYEPKINN